MSLEQAIQSGALVREPPRLGELQRLLAALSRRLDDARRRENHPDTRIDQAYLAIYTCALVALRTDGLRPADTTATKAAIFETLGDTLRVDEQRMATYRRIRDLRQKAIWDGALPLPRVVDEAAEEAVWLAERLQRWIEDGDRVARA